MKFWEWYESIDPAFFHTIIGIIIGGGITILGNLISKRKETQWRMAEKILDKKINAYEKIHDVILTTRNVIDAGYADEDHNLVGYPFCLDSKERFEEFWSSTFSIIHIYSLWLHPKLVKELGFFQDYIVNVSKSVDFSNPEKLHEMRIFIKQDFLDIAYTLEKEVKKFISQDILDLQAQTKYEWHKIPKAETLDRLAKTKLTQYIDQQIKKS